MAGSTPEFVIKAEAIEFPAPHIGYWRVVWRRFKRHRVAYVGFFFFVSLLFLVIAGPHMAPYELDQVSLSERMQVPSLKHWLGTDELGRDTWVRIMHGGRVSLAVGLIVGLSTVVVGGMIGIVAGYVGGVLDNALMRLVDIIYTIPRIVLLLVLSKLAGPGLLNIIVILVALEWTNAARLARSAVLSFREQEFVLAAQCLGASRWRVMLRHLLPNSLAPLIVAATLDAGAAIRAETTLSFLGLGIQPPTPSWGNLLTHAATNIFIAPLQVFLPGLFIFLALMSFNLLGDALRDALDPRLAERGGK
ncbi:MAG TPA: ABC transporter permease [Candidatus Binatia bacterium]|jgi:ABC-type dipeptide/oligopeptide/nickel transport system permease subunit|nr:ABC transporter permease [Candidatus Binatia bacterium]